MLGRRPSLHVALEGPAEEIFLVAESGIEARPAYAHGFRQIGQGGAFEAPLPEDHHGLVQRFVSVEFSGAALSHGAPLLHVSASVTSIPYLAVQISVDT